MPVYNAQHTIAPAIRSILAQTFSDWELLIIDDGSTDETLSVAQRFRDPRIRILSNDKNLGLPVRLNETIEQSRGKYYARMDGDDVAYPQRLARQISYFCDQPKLDLIGAWTIVFGSDGIALGKRAGKLSHADICVKPVAGFAISHPTFFGRLSWFKHWMYDSRAESSCDQDLLLRSFASSQFANMPNILLGYREERIRLTRLLYYRRLFAWALLRYFAQRNPWLATRGVIEQIIKAGGDCAAILLGLNYHILRHRAGPITDDERHEWECVWRSVQDGAR
jgi:glycosyltransferase involved in cell wall biosynthesis